MAKKKVVVPPPRTPAVFWGLRLSKSGRRFFFSGIILLPFGFWFLSFTDPSGQNWASILSPFILVLGYGLIGVGLWQRDPISPLSSPSSNPKN